MPLTLQLDTGCGCCAAASILQQGAVMPVMIFQQHRDKAFKAASLTAVQFNNTQIMSSLCISGWHELWWSATILCCSMLQDCLQPALQVHGELGHTTLQQHVRPRAIKLTNYAVPDKGEAQTCCCTATGCQVCWPVPVLAQMCTSPASLPATTNTASVCEMGSF